MAPQISMLEVPGARLHHETRGAGPALLMIPGGGGDAGPFERVADELAGRYTILTYDRRGFSRSPMEGPTERSKVTSDGDDAHQLIERVAGAPAYVFGSSSGAIVALDLMARYPQSVRLLVAHEPPLMTLLPETARFLDFADEVYEIYRRSGSDLAMQTFAAKVGLSGLDRAQAEKLPPHMMEIFTRIRGNDQFFLEHELRQYVRVVPDFAALKPVANRIVLAGGAESRSLPPYLPNTGLAERLGRDIVHFPGGHVGYITHAPQFAAQLATVLAAPGQSERAV